MQRELSHGLLLSVLNLQEITLTFREEKIGMKATFKRLVITFLTGFLQVRQDGGELKANALSYTVESHPGYLATWTEGQLAFGGLLGE